MTINDFVIVALVTYLIMLAAFFLSHIRRIHVPVMISIIVFDLCVPFYLFFNRDWEARLIDSGDILSFSVWMHFGFVLTLYILYAFQIHSVVKMLKRNVGVEAAEDAKDAKEDHRGQGKAILILRALVILTGTILIDPELAESGSAAIGS